MEMVDFEKKQKDGLRFEVPYVDNTAIIEKKGAYGFWYVRLERGNNPKQFEGTFTSVEEARKAVQNALNARNKKVAA
jgi:hypothetical protein